MDREGWPAIVHGVTKSWTQLRDYAGTHIIYNNRHTNQGILLTCLLLLKYNHNAHFIQQCDQIANMQWIRDFNDLQQTKFIPEKKKFTSTSLTPLKPLTVWITTNCSVSQFSCSVMSSSLQTHGHSRLPCPSLTPRAYLNSCPLSR